MAHSFTSPLTVNDRRSTYSRAWIIKFGAYVQVHIPVGRARSSDIDRKLRIQVLRISFLLKGREQAYGFAAYAWNAKSVAFHKPTGFGGENGRRQSAFTLMANIDPSEEQKCHPVQPSKTDRERTLSACFSEPRSVVDRHRRLSTSGRQN